MMWPILIGMVTVIVILGLAFWYACALPSTQVFGPALIERPDLGRRVVLTFDDGPSESSTEKILDILRDHKVPATFFVCGKNVERLPSIVRRALAEGHTIGNHTYSHPFLYFCRRATMAAEIDRTQEVLFFLRELLDDGAIAPLPIFLDSPLAREASLRRALKLNPKDAGTMCNLAVTAMSKGDASEALRYIRQAHRAAPDNEQYAEMLRTAEATSRQREPRGKP